MEEKKSNPLDLNYTGFIMKKKKIQISDLKAFQKDATSCQSGQGANFVFVVKEIFQPPCETPFIPTKKEPGEILETDNI